MKNLWSHQVRAIPEYKHCVHATQLRNEKYVNARKSKWFIKSVSTEEHEKIIINGNCFSVILLSKKVKNCRLYLFVD